jgi:hypothetical protein
MEVLLRHLLVEEKGEEGGAISADRVREHPSLEQSDSWYIPVALTKSNKGWIKLWFYLKNDAATLCQSSPAA